MFEPNPIQARLLMAVQNLAFENQHLIDRSRTAGQQLPPAALAHLRIGRPALDSFDAVATAVGVPRSVIDYSRAAGVRGHRWQPSQPFLATDEVSRSALLAGHRVAVADLQEMAGVGAAIARQATVSRVEFAAFRTVMGARWQQVGAIGHALGLTGSERRHAWEPTSTGWATTVARTVSGLDQAQVLARWGAIVDTDFATTMPVTVLRSAGISLDDIGRQLPVLPDRMVELAATALRTDPMVREQIGGHIEAAIEATGTDTHTDLDHADPTDTPDTGRRNDRDVGPDP